MKKFSWHRVIFVLFLILSMGTFVACSDDSASSNSCSGDEVCGRGHICDGGTCVQKACTVRADCEGSNRTCSPDGYCTAIECILAEDCPTDAQYICTKDQLCEPMGGCSTREECATLNKVCNLIAGECVDPPATCASDNDCVYPKVCDTSTGLCGDPAPPTCAEDTECNENMYCNPTTLVCELGCRVGGCPEGQFCNTDTRECAEGQGCESQADCPTNHACDLQSHTCVERTGLAICASCTAGSDECGAPGVDRCTPLGGGNGSCVFSCTTDTDCPSGYLCQGVSTAATEKYCIPGSGKCEGCMVDGCPEGQICNAQTLSCVDPIADCERCYPNMCAENSQCVEYNGEQRCLPSCENNTSCPADYTCDESDQLCKPNAGECNVCNLSCDPESDHPYFDEENCRCLACRNANDCAEGLNCVNGQCVSESSGQQCYTDEDCGDGAQCDPNHHVCYTIGICQSNEECPSGACEPDPLLNLPMCLCNDVSDCRNGEDCTFGYCSIPLQ